MANIQLSNDINIKIEYDPTNHKIGFDCIAIGNDGVVALTESDQLSTAIYVSKAGDNGNVGTYVSPVLTIDYAISICNNTHDTVIIIDNSDYIGEIATITNIYFQQLYKLTGSTARMTVRNNAFTATDANCIHVSKIGVDTNAGTASAPVLTIANAITKTTATKTSVVIMDSETYIESPMIMQGNFKYLYSDEFASPTIESTSPSLFWATKTVINGTSSAHVIPSVDVVTMPNGYVVVSYVPWSAGAKGRRVVYDSYGNVVLADGDYTSVTTGWRKVVAVPLNDTDVAVYYISYVSPNLLHKWQIINATTGATVKAEASWSASVNYRDILACSKTTGNNVMQFYMHYATGVWYHALSVYNAVTGAQVVAPITVTVAGIQPLEGCASVAIKDGTEIVLFTCDYTAVNNVYAIYMTKYNASGVITMPTTAIVTLATGGICNIACALLANGNIMLKGVVGFANPDDDIDYVYIVSDSGTLLYSQTTPVSAVTIIDSIGLGSSPTNSKIYHCIGTDTSGVYKMYLYETNNAFITNDIVDGKIYGVNISVPDGTNPSIGIFAEDYLTVKHCSITAQQSVSAYAKTPSDHIIISNNLLIGSNSFISDAVVLFNNQITNADYIGVKIDGASVSASDILIEHNDFVNNTYGLRLVNNYGTHETIINNNFSKNGGYGINADVAVGYSYGLNTDYNINATAGSQVIVNNPLYVNEGITSISALDLHLKNRNLGYPMSSPAIGRSDDNRNAGSYDTAVIGAQTSYTVANIKKPEIIPISREYVNAVNIQLSDGSYDSYKVAQSEIVELKWKGLMTSEFIVIDAIMCSDAKTVRVYFEPDTNPNTFYVFTLLRGSWGASSSYVVTDGLGKNDIALRLARRYVL